MRILVINCGSSTLKFELVEVDGEPPEVKFRIAHGLVDHVGGGATLEFSHADHPPYRDQVTIPDHGVATVRALDWLQESTLVETLDAVGHRVVHGGGRFVEPTQIDADTLEAIDAAGALAPLHNGPALEAIRSARNRLGNRVAMVACFDTAFHHRMPDHAALYAIPEELARVHSIRRYGFHGFAHRWMTERYATLTSKALDQVRIVTLQLGAGCSAAAVADGHSIDTSMGFTPLEGLMMGTRSGDLDPSLAGYLSRHEAVGPDEVEAWLNHRSGLLGVSGLSQDMRELLAAEAEGDERARLAVEMFCYRARKYIGAYLAVLGGVEAVVFGGGIGERSAIVRSRVCAGLETLGLTLDESLNGTAGDSDARISANSSAVAVWVIPVYEASPIAVDTFTALRQRESTVEKG